MVKRVTCGHGDWFDMKEDNTVYVNDQSVDEKYVLEPSFQRCGTEPGVRLGYNSQVRIEVIRDDW